MQRLSAAKACFLSEYTEDIPKPNDLVKLLDQVGHYWDVFKSPLYSHRFW